MSQNLDSLYPVVTFNPDTEPKERLWLINDLWQKNKVNGVAGFEKSGKSRLLSWLLVGMAKREVLGLRTLAFPKTFYLAAEETLEDDLQQRFLNYAELQDVAPAMLKIDVMAAMGLRLDLESQRHWLATKLEREQYKLMIIDPLIRVHGAKEDKNSEMAPFLTWLRRCAMKGTTVIFLHHTSKIDDETDMKRIANWFRGATDIAAIVDMAMYVDRGASGSIRLHRGGRAPALPILGIVDKGDGVGFSRGK